MQQASPMRVTFVLPHASLNGGVRVCAVYADHLRRMGHRVEIVSRPYRDFTLRTKVRHLLRGRPTRRPRTQLNHFDELGVPHRVIERFRPIEARDVPDADVIVATFWETAEWVHAMPASKGRPVYLIQHDERLLAHSPADRVNATWRLPWAERVVVAEWLRELGRREHGLDSVVIRNGVDTDFFAAPPRERRAPPAVGLMYSRTHFKGTDLALRAIEIARRTLPDLRVMAFGSEPIEGHMPLPGRSMFQFKPPQPRIREIYCECDAWLFASRSEGFGLPILEAMACGTPVIGAPVGAAPELIASGGGLLVKPEDPLDMARAIVELLAMSPPAWQKVSAAARATALANQWHHAADSFETVLHRVAKPLPGLADLPKDDPSPDKTPNLDRGGAETHPARRP
jgi:glycosyltransferase involved in cell wall biosynthesis